MSGIQSNDQEMYSAYSEIPLESEQIRLVQFNLGCTPINCKVEIYGIDKAPDFIALSYMWGLEKDTEKVWINGRPLKIRENLVFFIKELLRTVGVEKKYFWMDQISIDQDNKVEKSCQVALMSRIYGQADHVLIWLGQPNKERRGLAASFSTQDPPTPSSPPTSSSSSSTPSSEVSSKALPEPMELVRHLLSEEYFKRLWIKQEIILAKKVEIFIDAKNSIQWSTVRAIAAQRDMGDRFTEDYDSVYGLVVNNYASYDGQFGLCLHMYCTSGCFDPKDRVYGLASLIPKEERPTIDYGFSREKVFLDAVAIVWTQSFSDAHQHSPLCMKSVTAWMPIVLYLNKLGLAMQLNSDVPNLAAFTAAICEWGVTKKQNPIVAFCHTNYPSGGRWWFEAGGRKYHPDPVIYTNVELTEEIYGDTLALARGSPSEHIDSVVRSKKPCSNSISGQPWLEEKKCSPLQDCPKVPTINMLAGYFKTASRHFERENS